jgi:flagellar motor switch protein FliN
MADTAATQEAPPATPTEAAAPATAVETIAAAPSAAPQAATAEPAAAEQPTVEVHSAHLPEARSQAGPAGGGQVDILLNTTMPVTASLGQTTLQVRQILQLAPGSVVKLDRQVGEPIDLFLRGVRFATAQLVVVGDHLGVRIKEILSGEAGGGT